MFSYQEKVTRHIKRQKQFEETEQASGPDIEGMLEFSGWDFNIGIIDMQRAIVYRADSRQK